MTKVRSIVYRLAPRSIEAVLRERYDDPKIGMTHYVEIECPNSQTIIATEETEPDSYDKHEQLAGYDCAECELRHVFKWGPPAPFYVRDEPTPGASGDA